MRNKKLKIFRKSDQYLPVERRHINKRDILPFPCPVATQGVQLCYFIDGEALTGKYYLQTF